MRRTFFIKCAANIVQHARANQQAVQCNEKGTVTMLELQEPFVLAQLPRALTAEGKTWFNSVFGLTTTKKVKRYEVLAAVDGEAINIYDARLPES